MKNKFVRLSILLVILFGIASGASFLLKLETPILQESHDVILQKSKNDCGIAAAKNIVVKHGKNPDALDTLLHAGDNGVNLLEIKQALQQYGFSPKGYKTVIGELGLLPVPMIAHVSGNHFVVIEEVNAKDMVIIDPSIGRMKYPLGKFAEKWDGVALCISEAKIEMK
jgi:ATP-binding cassette, subfamily B, bacterial CvaB/MchF/RaxB